MIRIAHIKDGHIVNVSVAPDTWTAPEDGSQMTEAAALQQGLPRLAAIPAVPGSVTMLGMRFALIDADLLADVESAIEAIPDPAAKAYAQNWWHFSLVVEREHPLVLQLADTLSQSPAQVDALFFAALAHDQQ